MPKTPGLYIHVPFCITKCPYCDFYSTDETHLTQAWLDALEKEVLLCGNRFNRFGSLYLGGGTPTVLSRRAIEKLMEIIYKYFTFTPDAEITIEANPNDVTPEKLRIIAGFGFNRISLGVQAFDDEVLLFLKRRHTAHEAEKAIELIGKAGFKNLSIDLLYAIPGQTIDNWINTLTQALTFKPQHLSCYQLTLKEDTPLWHLKEKGALRPPDEAKEVSFFQTTAAFLRDNDYIHYEISNFAAAEKYYSAHNIKYWQHVPYLGLGPSAHSFFNNIRWWNKRSLSAYIKALAKGTAPIEGREKISDEQLGLETLFLNFRTVHGVDLETLKKYKRAETILPCLLKSGHVKISDSRVVPTTKGFLVADSIPLLFEQ